MLAAAIRRSRVVLGQSGEGLPQPNQDALGLTGFATMGSDPKPYLMTFPTLLRNIPVLEQRRGREGPVLVPA